LVMAPQSHVLRSAFPRRWISAGSMSSLQDRTTQSFVKPSRWARSSSRFVERSRRSRKGLGTIAMSFEPVIQRCVRPFSKVAFKPALTAQPGKLSCPRSGNDKPCRLDLAVLDDFRTLKHEGALASAQFPMESLHAD